MKLSLNNVRIRDKMLVVYFFSVFAPIVLTNFIFYNVTTENVKNQRMKDISLAVEQIKNEFRAEIEDSVSVSSVFYTDYNLNEILETTYEHPADYIEAYDSYFRRILNSYTPVYNSVQSITVYVDNPTMLHSGGVGYITEEVKDSKWYRLLEESDKSQPIIVRAENSQPTIIRTEEGLEDTFSVVRKMDYYTSKNKWKKILKIDMKTTSIHQIFMNLNLQGSIYLINNKGEVEYTTDPKIDWRREMPPYDSIELPPDAIEFETEYTSVNYLQVWRIIGTISEDEVFREVRKSRNFVIILACMNMILPTVIIVWITRSLNVRLVRILKHMKKVKNQYFDTIKHGESRDEIGQLTGEFNRMTLQIKSLIDDVYVADIQKKNLELQNRHAQLNALQSQINPHFLFNALETIRMRSLIKKEDETARIIHNMAKIFRNSLTWKKDMVTVKDEMELIHCFLEIQKYRFGDKLNYRITVDETAHLCPIPKMTFLPFVENASIHGIEPLKAGGIIELQIKREDSALLFILEDNGIGMDEDHLARLHGYLQNEEEMGDRVGIQNVMYRLKLYYGNRFRIQFASERVKGTTVRIAIPIEDEDIRC